MNVSDQFAVDLGAALHAASYRPIFLPEILVQICLEALPIDGASLSLLSDELRMPLAASDDEARTVELIQFTLGDGPCIDTYRTGESQSLNQADLVARWPLFIDEIAGRTRFKSITTIALALGGNLVGALDLYLESDDGLSEAGFVDALALGELVADALRGSPGAAADSATGPAWLRSPSMHQRATAWIAIGLIARAADLTAIDALDLIRSYAWQLGQTVDDISYELASHTLLATQLLDELRPST